MDGVGLHGGSPSRVRLHPEPAGTGLWLRQGRGRWRIGPENARAPGGCTVVGPVSTVEHLLGALFLAGITDLTVEVEGSEIPGLDGSAGPWLACLESVSTGWTEGRCLPALTVEAEGGLAGIEPAEGFAVEVGIDFGPGLRQRVVLSGEELVGVASARTFFPHARLDALLAAGAGRGVRSDGVVVWGARGPLVPLRMPDEPVRHKVLDLLGDLALLGTALRGRVRVERGSHALHLALVRACGPSPSRSG